VSETNASLGRLVSRFLTGAWRHSPPELRCSEEELARVAPLLLRCGAGALAWWRIRQSDLQFLPLAQELHQAYRSFTLDAAVHEHRIQTVFQLLRSAGVEPLLIKGWSSARLYAEPGLRPYADIDLWVFPDHYSAAREVLKSPEARKCEVDLHSGLPKLGEGSLADPWARSRLVRLQEIEIRVLGREDQMRILCTHLLHHNVWQPLWLCDVAAALEARPSDFDWDLCLGTNPVRRDWVACAIGLAHQLLGVEVAETPVAPRAQDLPRWIVPAVLRKWNLCRNPDEQWTLAALRGQLRNPACWHQEYRRRLDLPIRAAIRFGTHFDQRARIRLHSALYQAAVVVFSFFPWGGRLLRALGKRMTRWTGWPGRASFSSLPEGGSG